MKYLKITNKGEIDVNAFTLIGASTKREDDTKIGFFGSGNKYAIAYLMRNNFDIFIYSGERKIEFTANKKEFRGQQFDVLSVNGKETSITLQMGTQWVLWQAIREFYSNAIDEGLLNFEVIDVTEDGFRYQEGETNIYISFNNGLEDLMFNVNEYFLEKRKPIFECEYGAIYSKTGAKARIYRKGIKVYETNKNALFDYDLYKIPIDENRMALYNWLPAEQIWCILYSCTKKEVIRKVLNEYKTQGLIERELDDGITCSNDHLMSTQWLEVMENRQVFPESMGGWLSDKERIKTDFVGNKLYNVLTEKIGDSIKPKDMTFSENGKPYIDAIINNTRAKLLSEVINFFADADFKMDYKIKVVDFKNKQILGSINKDDQIILLDVQSLDLGFDQTVNTVIEEYVHLKFGVADETRGFQNSIITEFINYMKKKIH